MTLEQPLTAIDHKHEDGIVTAGASIYLLDPGGGETATSQ